jgi:hypothetical protein
MAENEPSRATGLIERGAGDADTVLDNVIARRAMVVATSATAEVWRDDPAPGPFKSVRKASERRRSRRGGVQEQQQIIPDVGWRRTVQCLPACLETS